MGGALDEHDPQLRFQLTNQAAHCRLTDPKPRGSPAEAQLLRHSHKPREMTQLHEFD